MNSFLKQLGQVFLKHISHAYTMSRTKLSQQSETLKQYDATRQEKKLSDEFLNSIDPQDLADLQARAEKQVERRRLIGGGDQVGLEGRA